MKLIKLKLLISLIFIVSFNFVNSQNKDSKNISKLNSIIINTILKGTDSLLINDLYINKFKLNPIFVLYLNDFNINKKSFTFSLTTTLNYYELKIINPSHIFNYANKTIIIRYNYKTITSNLIDEIFNKISNSDNEKLIQGLKSIGSVVGPRYAVIYKYNNGKLKEEWLDSRNNLPIDLDYIDNNFIKKHNDSIMRIDSINIKNKY